MSSSGLQFYFADKMTKKRFGPFNQDQVLDFVLSIDFPFENLYVYTLDYGQWLPIQKSLLWTDSKLEHILKVETTKTFNSALVRERRKDQRHPCRMEIVFSYSKKVFKTYTVDLSKGGVSLEKELPVVFPYNSNLCVGPNPCGPPAPPVSCVGTWGPCLAPGMQTFTVITPASGGGSACPSPLSRTCTLPSMPASSLAGCGTSANIPATSAPSSGLCVSGNVVTPAASYNVGSKWFEWGCQGTDQTLICHTQSQTMLVNGDCDLAATTGTHATVPASDNGGSFPAAPSAPATMCSLGNPNPAPANNAGSTWTWNCDGVNGGTAVSCSAAQFSGCPGFTNVTWTEPGGRHCSISAPNGTEGQQLAVSCRHDSDGNQNLAGFFQCHSGSCNQVIGSASLSFDSNVCQPIWWYDPGCVSGNFTDIHGTGLNCYCGPH